MLHAMVFHGTMRRNHKRLRSNTSVFWDTSDVKRPLPETTARGIHFGCMNDGRKILVVKAGPVVLDTPIPWDSKRHTDGKGIIGTQPTTFGHESAARLLDDIARENPGQLVALRSLSASLGRRDPAGGPDAHTADARRAGSSVGGALRPSRGRAASGAGFGDPDQNAEVARAAVVRAIEDLRAEGWDVESVEHDRLGYDLRCSHGGEQRHVEVKGVKGAAPTFIITDGEVRCAESDADFWLYLVTDALGTAALLRLDQREFLRRVTLQPIAYRAVLAM